MFSGQTTGNVSAVYLEAPVTLATNTWTFLVLNFTETNSDFYQNGALVTNANTALYKPDAYFDSGHI